MKPHRWTHRRMLDVNTEVDNGTLVGSASAVILDSQPAELHGNECCCWSCQPVVIHYGRGGSQSSKEISQHDGFLRGLLPALGCSCLQGGSLAASLQHTGLFFWWRWRGSNTDLTKSALGKWMNMNQISQLCGWSSLPVATSIPAPGTSSDSGRQQVSPQLQPHSFWPVPWEDKWAVL